MQKYSEYKVNSLPADINPILKGMLSDLSNLAVSYVALTFQKCLLIQFLNTVPMTNFDEKENFDLSLIFQDAEWHITEGGYPLTGSLEERSQIEAILPRLLGRQMLEIQIAGERDLHLSIAGEFTIATQLGLSDGEWILKRKDVSLIANTGGNEYLLGKYE